MKLKLSCHTKPLVDKVCISKKGGTGQGGWMGATTWPCLGLALERL